ncbi:chemotaxis protein CheA [Kurthia huakuii]|uniref:chemotaxis protein CheA n=1 Tax=Kurthia huakuii TaxID=1421019 RepID=UPI0004968397|nr:chemotaxis protein CheA [Kurthia huakuii]MBM7698310.1 two-component system chemotaxis sensor kinase CheA [Kurthia huakuii]
MDTNQYLEVFIDESTEHLQSCNENLLALEQNPHDLSIVNEIFRNAHTLKGMSATMGFEDLADLTHKMENVLDAIRNEKIEVSPEILDVVFESIDHLEAMIGDISEGGDGKRNVVETVEKLKRIENGEAINGTNEKALVDDITETIKISATSLNYDDFERTIIEQSHEQGFETYEIAISLRDDCLLKAARVFMVFEVLEKNGDVIKSVPAVEQLEAEQFDTDFSIAFVTKEDITVVEKLLGKVSEVEKVVIQKLNSEVTHEVESLVVASTAKSVEVEVPVQTTTKAVPDSTAKQVEKPTKTAHATSKTIRVNIERLDILMNLFEELVIDRGRLQSIAAELNHNELNESVERMSRVSSDLQNIILNMRMVPVETVFNRFPKMVRQLSRDLNKKVKLDIIGAETELDRTVIDEIGDPLVHLIRNSLDHGVESPEIRLAAGKPEEGHVELRAYHSGNHVFIEIEDDGAGINKERVLSKALEKGVVTPEIASKLTDNQINELILASGFSTAEVLSDISGRGVGLDVVKSTIESLGGNITIESEEGKGSLFSVQLPLTLSIISVMLIEIEQETYAIPLSSIIETSIIRKSDIMNAHNQKVIDFRGKVVPLVFLEEIFEVPRNDNEEDDFHSIVIVRKGDKMAGLVVDSFIGQQEIVLKSLGNYLTNVFAISGATILGNGQVALIIDCNSLIK